MTQKVQYEFSATDTGLARTLNNLDKEVAKLDGNMFRLQDRLNRALTGMQKMGGQGGGSSPLGMPLRQVAGLAAGYFSVQAALSKALAVGREFSQEGLEASKKWDLLFREFAGQSNLRGGLLKQAESRIKQVGQEVGLDIENTARAATQMVSSGFSAQEASGESLREFLRGFVASNLAGQQVDMRDLTQATASYLDAQQMEMKAENVRDVIQRVQALYKATNMNFADFSEFARESGPMRNVLTTAEQIASYATLRQEMTAEEAATGLRNVTQRMRTAAGTKEKVDGLKMLGLRPQDVDMVGEDFMEAMKRLRDAWKKTAPEVQPIALKRIFEERGVAIAQKLMESLDKVAERIKLQAENKTQFEADAKFASQGVNAASRRQENERLAFMANSGRDTAELRFQEMRQYMLEKGVSPLRADINVGLARGAYYMGMNSAAAVQMGSDMLPGAGQIIERRVQAKLQGLNLDPKAIEKNVLRATNPLNFSPEDVNEWEMRRAEFKNPHHMFRKTRLNPWYDRAGRFPQENKAILEARKIEAEMEGRLDAFGSLSPEEQARFSLATGKIQGRADKLDRNVHTYDLQLILNRVAEALEKNTAATAENTKVSGSVPLDDLGARIPYRPTTAGQQRGGGP